MRIAQMKQEIYNLEDKMNLEIDLLGRLRFAPILITRSILTT